MPRKPNPTPPPAPRVTAADGIYSVVNSLANERNALAQNAFAAHRLSDNSLRALWSQGLCAKIVRLKAGYSLNDTLQFADEDDELLYRDEMERAVKQAARYMVGFGRGLICVAEPGEDLASPRRSGAKHKKGTVLQVFSGDMVSVGMVEPSLLSPRYQRPLAYIVRGQQFHHSRCVDFVYYRPAELDAPAYKYGGISEFELIVQQLMADEIVQRAAPHVLEKSAQKVYKVPGFAEALQAGQHDAVVTFFRLVEQQASIYGATVVDKDVEVEGMTQALSGMADIDTFTLRRLAMVTGIPLALLVGENVKGLNSTGEQERASFQDMIETLQFDHLLEPIQDLCAMYGVEGVEFKDNQGGTALERAELDGKILANARALMDMGEDFGKYLADNGLRAADPAGSLLDYPEPDPLDTGVTAGPTQGLPMNPAQLAALVGIVEKATAGSIPRGAALSLIRLAVPSMSAEQAADVLGGPEAVPTAEPAAALAPTEPAPTPPATPPAPGAPNAQ